nr:hypothetical protein LNOBJIOA_00071 [Enterobacter kobei]WOL76125.1 hypothetical protein NILFGBLM_00077 [Klebsiella michiganensis]WOL76285.1 hypothetical protein LNEFFDNF_00086 [Escherichia coli]WOL76372.1 hypothetical protein EEPPGFAC_00087 [Citrobacter freundii]WOL76541.1 hypothetical protein KAOECJJK_00085 [Raoultella ornithinolytica]WOL76628.1 hypothetical protein JPHEFJEH_00087 [Enterobacter cloacae]WOL77091.1 hypothetical protein CEFOHLLP_00050 [Enterobacter hormaechei subsp. hoffmann
MFPLLPPTVDGALVQGGVDPHIRLVCQPVTDASVGSSTIEQQPRALHPGQQRVVEALAEVAIEALDLAFGLGPIRATQPDPEPQVIGQLKQAGVKTVLAVTVGIAFQHHGLHVVEQHLAGHTAQIVKSQQQGVPHGLEGFVRYEGDKRHAAVSQRGDEGRHGGSGPAQDHEISLQLPSGLGLETDGRTCFAAGGLERGEEGAQ